MSTQEIDRLIEEARNYLDNMNRFYKDILYVGTNINQTLDLAVEVKEKKIEYKTGRKIERDLFGNEINRQEEWEFSQTLEEMNSLICECQKCSLGKTRNKFVFGVGNPNADIVLIGEAPGAEEDQQGEPFVGRAGKLLDKILEAIGFKREEVYICNILKCRPPGNRNPLPEEIETCLPYLSEQIKIIKPKLILLLGRVAAEALLRTKQPLNKLRGKIHFFNGIKTFVTFHPAALLRNPQWKRPAWEDMKEFKKYYEELK